jgi:hypothetical protein
MLLSQHSPAVNEPDEDAIRGLDPRIHRTSKKLFSKMTDYRERRQVHVVCTG